MNGAGQIDTYKQVALAERPTLFDHHELQLDDIAVRGHDLHAPACLTLQAPDEVFQHEDLGMP